MPEDAPSSPAGDAALDDLERRLASFESATKRLNRNVGGIKEPETAATGHSSPPRPATRRLSDSGAPRSDEISGLRPAVQLQGPQTGALTARARGNTGNSIPSGTPGFTSSHGKPTIPMTAAATSPVVTNRTTRSVHRPRPAWHWVLAGCVLATLLGLALLPRLFPVLPDAAVWAETRSVATGNAGQVEAVRVRVGDSIVAGQVLARIAGADVASPFDGTVSRLLVATGARLTAGEMVAEIALPESRRVVVALPNGLETSVGDRVRIELLGERRSIDGNVELVLSAGSIGPWPGSGASPRRAVLQPAPSPLPLGLSQGARVTLIGSSSGRQLLHALRSMLPW